MRKRRTNTGLIVAIIVGGLTLASVSMLAVAKFVARVEQEENEREAKWQKEQEKHREKAKKAVDNLEEFFGIAGEEFGKAAKERRDR